MADLIHWGAFLAVALLFGVGLLVQINRYGNSLGTQAQAQSGQRFATVRVFGSLGASYKNDDCDIVEQKNNGQNYFLDQDGQKIYCNTNRDQKGYFKWLASHRDALWGGGRDNAAQGTLRKLRDDSLALGLPPLTTFSYERPLDNHEYTDYRAGGEAELQNRADAKGVNWENFYLHYGQDVHLADFRSYPQWYGSPASTEDQFYYLYQFVNQTDQNHQNDSQRYADLAKPLYFGDGKGRSIDVDLNNIDNNSSTYDEQKTEDLYFGSFKQFYEANFTIVTGASGVTGQWQYCDQADPATGMCSSGHWVSLENADSNKFSDQTKGLTVANSNSPERVYFAPPSNWQRVSVSTKAAFSYQDQATYRGYYIRFHLSIKNPGFTLPTLRHVNSTDYIKFAGTNRADRYDQGCDPSGQHDPNNPQKSCYVVAGWNPKNDRNNDGFVDDQEYANLVDPTAHARLRLEARAPFSFMDYPSFIKNPADPTFQTTLGDLYGQWLNYEQGQGSTATFDGTIFDDPVSFGDWNGAVVSVNGGQYDPSGGYGPGYFVEYATTQYPQCLPMNAPYQSYCARTYDATGNESDQDARAKRERTVSGNSRDGDYTNHVAGLWDRDYASMAISVQTSVNHQNGPGEGKLFGFNPSEGSSQQIEVPMNVVFKEHLLRARNGFAQFENQLATVAGLHSRGKTVVMDNTLELIDLAGITENDAQKADPYSPWKSRDKLLGLGEYLLAQDAADYYAYFSSGNSKNYHASEDPNNRGKKRDGSPYTAFDQDRDIWSDIVARDLGQPTGRIPAWAQQAGAVEVTDSNNQPLLQGAGLFRFSCGTNECQNVSDPLGNNGGIQSGYRLYGREYSKGVVFVKIGQYNLGNFDYLQRGNKTLDDLGKDVPLGVVLREAEADNKAGHYFSTVSQMPNNSALIVTKTTARFVSDDRSNGKDQTVADDTLSVGIPAQTLKDTQQLVGSISTKQNTPPAGDLILNGSPRELALSDGTDTLGKAASLTFSYAGLDLSGALPETLVVGHCKDGVCVPLATTVNTSTKTLTASTTTLSDFVVLAPIPATPTPTPTATFTATPTDTATPTFTPTATFTPSPSPTSTFTPTPSPTATFTPTPSPTATFTPTPSPTPSPSPTATNTPTQTPAPTNTATPPGNPAKVGSPTPTVNPATNQPRITITQIRRGRFFFRNLAYVSVNVTNPAQATRVELYLDDALTAVAQRTPFLTRFNYGRLPSGTHTVFVRVYAVDGTSSDSEVLTFVK